MGTRHTRELKKDQAEEDMLKRAFKAMGSGSLR